MATDIEITNHGSIFLFTPKTQAGREFVADAPEDAQFWGLSLVVEHRFANDVAEAAIDAGLHIK